ncbi:MAG: helicase, partial [Sphingomicrobium sp.]
AGAATLDATADMRGAALAYRRFGNRWLRVDLADRIAAHAHQVRAAGGGEPVDAALVISLGLDAEMVRKLMAEIGFVPAGEQWRWRGRRPERPSRAPDRANAFAALAGLRH